MWKGWSSETNVTSMTSDRCPKTEERRWWKALWITKTKNNFIFTYCTPPPFAASWHLTMESSSWRLVQRRTSMWRMWVCVMFFCLDAPRLETSFVACLQHPLDVHYSTSWELSFCCTCVSCFPQQSFLTLARDIKAKMDKKLVSTK